MARSYKRKTSRQSLSQEDLEAAVNSVLRGKTLGQAVRLYHISFETLRRVVGKARSNNKIEKPVLGFQHTFSKDQEQHLRNEILSNVERMQGYTANNIRKIARALPVLRTYSFDFIVLKTSDI